MKTFKSFIAEAKQSSLEIHEHPFDSQKLLDFHMRAADPQNWHVIPDVPMKQGTIVRHYGVNLDGAELSHATHDHVHYNTLPVDHESIPKHVADDIKADAATRGGIVQHVHIYKEHEGGYSLVHFNNPDFRTNDCVKGYWHDNMKVG